MKKIFYLLIGILLLPSMVKADMASPTVITYKAIVNNPNGIPEYKLSGDKYEKTGKTVKYGTVYVISGDEYIDEYICADDDCKTYVRFTDLTTADKEYKINKENIGDEYKLTTIKKVDIKSGPANLYETISTLEPGTVLKGHEIINITDILDPVLEYIPSLNPWYYVEYNGVKGFVNSYGGTMMIGDLEEGEFMTAAKVEIKDPITLKVLKTIEPSTIIKAKTGYLDDWSSDCYIEYDGVKGIADRYHLVSKHISEEEKYNKHTFKSDLNIYDVAYVGNEVGGGKVIGTLPANTTFTSYYEADYGYIYYEDANIKGWVNEYEDTPKKEEPIVKPEEPKKEETDVVVKPKNDYTLYICIGIGVVLSLTAVITIILINKKKKNKEL